MTKPNLANIKQLAINHFEKAIFVVVCVLALAMLVGTRWVPYTSKHHPIEITDKVDKGERTIANKPWSKEEQEQFVVPKEQTVEFLVANIRRQIDVSPYQFDEPFVRGVNDDNKPVEEPDYLPVRSVIANAGRFLMGVAPEDPLLDDESVDDPALMAGTETVDDQSNIPEEFRARATTPGLGFGGESDEYALNEEDDSMEGMEEESYSYGTYGGYGGEELGMVSMMDGRGLRYVSVRGIIQLRDQIRKFMKSLNIRSFAQASSLYEIIDFELQRKKMQPGDDPWGSEWEPVDIEVAIDILNESLSFDAEVVPTAITDPVVTMPLPGRLMGIWQSKATHPDLENFTLSPEEMQKEMMFNAMMLEEYQKQEENKPQEPVKKKGFNEVAGSSRAMQSVAFGTEFGDETMDEEEETEDDFGDEGSYGGGGYAPMRTAKMSKEAEEFLKKIKDKKFTNDKERNEAMLDYIKQRITAVGELLLFRYFDFDVEPGATYKYRVRLEVRNPNYGLSVAQAGGQQYIVEGQTRKSDWSNETEPTTVPYDVDYFVAKVEQNSSRLPEADMAVFQWNPDLGTTVSDRIEVSYGEEIGGPTDTLVLNPAQNRFEYEPYKFHTGDVLVDALPKIKISSREHPDLELPRSARGQLNISSQVLISKGNDELAVIDSRSRIPAFESRRQSLMYEQQPYEAIKNKLAKKPDPSDLPLGEGFEEYEGDESMDEDGGGGSAEDFGRGRRGGNPLRKRTSARGR